MPDFRHPPPTMYGHMPPNFHDEGYHARGVSRLFRVYSWHTVETNLINIATSFFLTAEQISHEQLLY